MKRVWRTVSELALCALVFLAGYGCLLRPGYESLGAVLAVVSAIGAAVIAINAIPRYFKGGGG